MKLCQAKGRNWAARWSAHQRYVGNAWRGGPTHTPTRTHSLLSLFLPPPLPARSLGKFPGKLSPPSTLEAIHPLDAAVSHPAPPNL